jgi:hypothetical protein
MKVLIALVSILSLMMLGCGPIGPFSGGRLSGQDGAWPVDWNAAADIPQIQLETAPEDPHSINVWVVVLDGEAFIVTSLLLGTEVPEERAWVRNITADSRIRIRVDGIVYPARLEAVDDSMQIAQVFELFRVKYPELKASRADGARFFQIVKRSDATMA